MTNRGDVAERLQLVGTKRSKAFRTTYLAGGKNVTAAVVDGSYRTESLKAGDSVVVTVKVIRLKAAKKGSRTTMSLRAVSTHAHGTDDTISARVTRGRLGQGRTAAGSQGSLSVIRSRHVMAVPTLDS